MTTETGTWFTERDAIADRLASLAGSAATAEFPYVIQDETHAGEVMGEFVERCLAEERAMTASLEARGLRLVASAGTVVAVLIGLVALTPKTLSGLSGSLLGVGVGCLLASASLAIVCASPKRALEVDPTSVEAKLSDQFWRAKSEYARRSVARSQLKVWASVRVLNDRLNWWLRMAVVVHVVGLAIMSVGALVLVIG